jgi:CheY-like chemotaxis protein
LNTEVDILLVEDNAGDVRLVSEAIAAAGMGSNLSVARDGVEAMDFLRGQGRFVDASTPDLILLDLNMPKRSGLEVLNEIKCDDRLRVVPVIILTSSQADHDVMGAYGLHANCYITKPSDFEDYVSLMKLIGEFWLNAVVLPRTASISASPTTAGSATVGG